PHDGGDLAEGRAAQTRAGARRGRHLGLGTKTARDARARTPPSGFVSAVTSMHGPRRTPRGTASRRRFVPGTTVKLRPASGRPLRRRVRRAEVGLFTRRRTTTVRVVPLRTTARPARRAASAQG